MELIADILLGAGAIGAGIYCMVLSRRLQKLTQLESGMGGAIAVLSTQVDELTRTLGRAEAAAKSSSSALETQTRRAEDAVKRLELLISTLHDLPEPAAPPAPTPAPAPAAEPAEPRLRVLRRRMRRPVEQEA